MPREVKLCHEHPKMVILCSAVLSTMNLNTTYNVSFKNAPVTIVRDTVICFKVQLQINNKMKNQIYLLW